jgi:ADP-heptose:LPS heptosyltransferase
MKPGRRPPGGFGVAFVPDVCFLAHLWFPVSAARFVFAKSAGKPHNPRVSAAKKKDSGLPALLSRHAAAFGYVLREVLPVILRTGRRPVIFSRHTGMGDIICTIPAARELMKRHPGATFIYNCHADFAAVPKLAGITGHITSLTPIGLVGHWYGFLLAGFYHFTHGDDTPDRVAQESMVAEFLRQFNLPVTEEHPALPVTTAGREKALAMFARKNLDPSALVLIHPGPSWPVKEWPRENWARLVAELRARGFTSIGQLGVGRYMNFGKVEVPPVPGAVSLLDAFTVEECIAAIASAKLFIGIDSGLLHIAAAARTPAVGIWGCTSPRFFYAENVRKNFVVSNVACQGCYHRLPRLHWVTGCPHDIRCMKEISVDEVLRACLTKLEPAAK